MFLPINADNFNHVAAQSFPTLGSRRLGLLSTALSSSPESVRGTGGEFVPLRPITSNYFLIGGRGSNSKSVLSGTTLTPLVILSGCLPSPS